MQTEVQAPIVKQTNQIFAHVGKPLGQSDSIHRVETAEQAIVREHAGVQGFAEVQKMVPAPTIRDLDLVFSGTDRLLIGR